MNSTEITQKEDNSLNPNPTDMEFILTKSVNKRRKTKANKLTAHKDVAAAPRPKRRTTPLSESNRSKENIICNTRKPPETGVHSTEQKENFQNTILEQILQRLSAIELRQ
ncbi:13826_t:CDS:2, partial [Dentiscutata heterogama]